MSSTFTRDGKIGVLGDEFGPGGPMAIVALLGAAKEQNHGGRVEQGWRELTVQAFLDRGQAKAIVERAAELGVIEVEDLGEVEFVAKFPQWRKWQEAFRSQRNREATQETPSSTQEIRSEYAADTQRSASGNAACNATETETGTDNNSNVDEPSSPTGQTKGNSGDQASRAPSPTQQVFDAWVEATGKRKGATKLTDERRRLIRKALKTYPVDDLVDAVRGWKHSPHHRGENDRHQVYNDIELLLRNAKQIETFRDLERGASTATDSWSDFLAVES